MTMPDRSRTDLIMYCIVPVLFVLGSMTYWLLYRSAPLLFWGYLVVLPFFFGLVVDNLAGRFGLWTWTKPVLHYALITSAYTQLLFFVTGTLLIQPTTIVTTLECAIAGPLIAIPVGMIHDILALEYGFCTMYNRAHFKNLGSIASVLSYGFYYFGVYGVAVGLSAKLGHFYLVETAPAVYAYIPISIGAFLVPFVAWVVFLGLTRTRLRSKRRPRDDGARGIDGQDVDRRLPSF
jgi:hypothetical protein